MQSQTSMGALAVCAFVALLKLFLQIPRSAQLTVLAAEAIVLGLISILVWRGETCQEIAPADEPQAVLLQPLVLVPLKGERDSAESDVETESTAGTDAAATETGSDAEDDSDWSGSDDVDMPWNCSFPHAAWDDVGMRLATVFHLVASEPITSDDEGSLIVAKCTAGRASADRREVTAFGWASADSDHDDEGRDDDCHYGREGIVSSSKITCRRSPYAQTPETEACADPWVTIGLRLSAAFSEISASAFDDEEDFPQVALGWSAIGGRLASTLRQIASGEPLESDDEDGFPTVVQSLPKHTTCVGYESAGAWPEMPIAGQSLEC